MLTIRVELHDGFIAVPDSVALDNGIGAVAAIGTVCATPTKTTTYTLTALSAKGTVTKLITVVVLP